MELHLSPCGLSPVAALGRGLQQSPAPSPGPVLALLTSLFRLVTFVLCLIMPSLKSGFSVLTMSWF